ncbi:MAG: hypothetical protein K0S61_160 [Anaerocolumna sp.]|jgi:hypothetical protein|nr:hypothetical protein [Anaerocolumna sp.]
MNKIEMVKNTISRTAGRSGLILQKYSPEILMTVGVAGIVASTVLACRATLKVDEVLDTHEEKIGKIKKAWGKVESGELSREEYSENDYKKDLTVATVQTGVDFVKLYGPSIVLGAASIGCVLGAHGIMKKRNIALIAAYKAVETSFSDYRKRVVDEFGSEKDRILKNGIKQNKVKVTEIDEDGKEKKVTKVVETTDPNGISQYARYFDESSTQWSNTPEYNLTFLKCQQNYANDLLHSRGHIFLNEVYDMLGIPRSTAGSITGWAKGYGDDFVDFGLFDGEKMAVRDFVNGYERSILLDFNVAGVIYDMI